MILDEVAPRQEYTITELYHLGVVSEYRIYKALKEKKLRGFRKFGTGKWLILGSDFVTWYTDGIYAGEQPNPREDK